MTDEQGIDAQLAAAVEAQRQNRDKLFVFLRPEVAHLPGLMPALAALADETGRTLAPVVVESENSLAIRKHVERLAKAPSIARTDHRKILENLDGIRAGTIRVD